MRSHIYSSNKASAIFYDETPTMTDQAGARETDINVIVGQFGISGTVPGARGEPQYGDFTELPDDLRGMIEKARELHRLRDGLPEEYRSMSTEELLNTSPTQLAQITANAKTIRERRAAMPDHMKRMSDQDILGLTSEQYKQIITPPTHTPENK